MADAKPPSTTTVATPPAQPAQAAPAAAPAPAPATPAPSPAPASTTATPKPPPRPVPTFLKPLQFMGVPRGVLTWKPRLPSRNWSIFLVTVGTLSYLYYDDRKQCRQIRRDYCDKVSHLAHESMRTNDWPRKVVVYTTKSPGDDDYDQALRYFKKYVKPILVAAAVDWEVTNGTKHGGLARELQARFQERRRKLLGLEPWDATASDPNMPHSPFALTPQQQLQREIDGGIVLVGRPALKEWAWALKNGWGTPLEVVKRDRDQEIAAELAEDHAFDELPVGEDEQQRQQQQGDGGLAFAEMSEKDRAIAALADGAEADGAGAPLPSRFGGAGGPNPAFGGGGPNAFTSMMQARPTAGGSDAASPKPKTEAEVRAAKMDARLLEPPAQIPAQPPICFVDFTNLVGWRNIPLRMYNFFRVRDKVRAGAELGLTIVYGTKETARDFQAGPSPASASAGLAGGGGEVSDVPPQGGDLDWGLESEERYAPYFLKTADNIDESRRAYYKALPTHLKDARDLARGVREPSRLERNDPPKTEAELREQRLKKEVGWRNNLMGFDIIRPERGVEWDERWRGSIRVFTLDDERRRVIDAEQQERRERQQREGSSGAVKGKGKGVEVDVVVDEELKGSKPAQVVEESQSRWWKLF
ncbi:related to TIM54 (component of the mitochondrial TIM22 translocase) [Pseudozyma flocculosa]|uniref:Mitochondrial import inner membrane translocase subunit TIM54 n=1 Tax=Pseudozyma flocculosa TaxID=84751 RepID=A0A5C3FFH4_9BASI|nr:related to TIM54 (component of the mitochondrial TIM22 translocase) [Pseudozyma flocculosa]